MVKCQTCSRKAHYGLPDTPARFCRDHQTEGMVNRTGKLCQFVGCKSTSRSFNLPGLKGAFCKKHKTAEMVNVVNPLCVHEGCISTSITFDLPGGKGRFCKAHATSMMVNVKNPICEHEGCESTSNAFDMPGGKGKFCGDHKLDGMVNVRSPTCEHDGCTTKPMYGEKGKPSRFCAKHKLDGMCSRGACEFEDCHIQAGCNYPRETKFRFCTTHKLEGMVNLRTRKCQHTGCKKASSFGFKGHSTTHCAVHKEDGMINLVSKYCEYEGCDISASFAFKRERQRFCQTHAEEGMVGVMARRCTHEGCESTSRNYDIPGGKGSVCAAHKEPGMIDVKSRRCEDCTSIASVGKPGSQRSHCRVHRKPGMITLPRARCLVCRKPAFYGVNYIPRRCEAHKTDEDQNLIERECVSCKLVMVLDKDDKCEFCVPHTFETNRLAKQNALMAHLDFYGLTGDSTDKVVNDGDCGRERPDRVFDFGDKVVVLECDEHQHKDRQCSCEQTRMVNISQGYGGLPVYFIRWNPDPYAPSVDTKKRESVEKRHKMVCDYIHDIRRNKIVLPKALLSVLYMFHDGWHSLNDVEWEVVTPFSQTSST